MSERLSDEAEIALVTFTTSELIDEYQQRRSLSVPILVDADRSVYAAYGLGRGSLRSVWGLDTLRRYVEILRSTGWRQIRRELSPAAEDTRQLGGDFVIAPNGTIAYAYRGSGPADRPDVEALAAAVRAATP